MHTQYANAVGENSQDHTSYCFTASSGSKFDYSLLTQDENIRIHSKWRDPVQCSSPSLCIDEELKVEGVPVVKYKLIFGSDGKFGDPPCLVCQMMKRPLKANTLSLFLDGVKQWTNDQYVIQSSGYADLYQRRRLYNLERRILSIDNGDLKYLSTDRRQAWRNVGYMYFKDFIEVKKEYVSPIQVPFEYRDNYFWGELIQSPRGYKNPSNGAVYE